MLQRWIEDGDTIRELAGSDAALIDGLRFCLPVYRGCAVTLYRGDSAFNRRRRTYGMSWSSDRSTAEGFARGVWQAHEGGSVLLKTLAPAEAIFCAPALLGDEFAEGEYLVDRRRLVRVEVLKRFPQVPMLVTAPEEIPARG